MRLQNKKCFSSWCHDCYRIPPADVGLFPIKSINIEDGFEEDESEPDRFMVARKGDRFLNTFQCDTCHFQNVNKRNPSPSACDQKYLKYIRRANLDCFWSREPGTVRGTFYDVKRMIKFNKEFNLPPNLPQMGPFPLEDNCGMGPAVLMLRRTQDPGIYGEHVQYETARKI